jgi:hypothetical protein
MLPNSPLDSGKSLAFRLRRMPADLLRLRGRAVDVFLKRDDISEESKRKLLVDNTARFYGV